MSKDPRFKEKVDFVDAIIDETKEKLGDKAAEVTEQLINIKATLVEATEIHDGVFDQNEDLAKKNADILKVNNDLYIKNSSHLKTHVQQETVDVIEEDVDLGDQYAELIGN